MLSRRSTIAQSSTVTLRRWIGGIHTRDFRHANAEGTIMSCQDDLDYAIMLQENDRARSSSYGSSALARTGVGKSESEVPPRFIATRGPDYLPSSPAPVLSLPLHINSTGGLREESSRSADASNRYKNSGRSIPVRGSSGWNRIIILLWGRPEWTYNFPFYDTFYSRVALIIYRPL